MHLILVGDITRVSATYFHSIISIDIYHSSGTERVCLCEGKISCTQTATFFVRRKKSVSDRNRERERGIAVSEHRFGTSPKERTLISRDTERICICKPERRHGEHREYVKSPS